MKLYNILSRSMFAAMLLLVLSGAQAAHAVTYDSCKDAREQGQDNNGTYNISGLGDVYCDMETNHGGWLGVTPQMARDDFNGTLEMVDGNSNTDKGFDSSDRPHTRDGSGDHTAQYTFRLPYTVKQFFFKDYTAKSNAGEGSSSDLFKQRFIQDNWNTAHDLSVGDISFGFANDNGPMTSFAKEKGNGDGSCNNVDDNGYCLAQNQIVSWPDAGQIYTSSDGDNDFRISWGDEGNPSEGWYPWWGGMIMVRESRPDVNNNPLKIDIRNSNIESDNDVEIAARVTGDPTNEDSKIKVEFENKEGGDCAGNWEDATIKNGARATNDDTDGDPDVDNQNNYQIGSENRTRVIADGSRNTVTFKWDATEDLGSNPRGRYCVRVKIRSDDGEIDTDTYIVTFNGGEDLNVRIRNVNIESDNDVKMTARVSGDPTNEDSKIKVEYESDEGGQCNGAWDDAYIKSGARATNDDTDGDPDVDNQNSYQIGSENRTRVIADGQDNDVVFAWDAERDLGNNPRGRYCVRVTIRSDDGASDNATYIVNFGNVVAPTPTGKVTITSPVNSVIVTTPNPAIIGTGIAGNTILLKAPNNRVCTATVLSSGGWTCSLVGLPSGAYSVIAYQYMPNGTPNGTANGSFVIGQTVIPSQPGGLCQQHITSYMKLGQYNDSAQVRKLQEYLNSRESEQLAVTGVFDHTTEAAVKRYQAKYAQDILYPWGMRAPSGYVFKTTINHINRQLCSGQVQCPVFTQYHKMGQSGGEIGTIQSFLKQYGYYNGGVTGYFDRATDRGIKAFQEEFRPMILTPWKLPQPTGNWYKTSRKHANWLNGCYERVSLEGMGITF